MIMPGKRIYVLNGLGRLGRGFGKEAERQLYADIIPKESETPVIAIAQEDYSRFGAMRISEIEQEYDVKIIASDQVDPVHKPVEIHTLPDNPTRVLLGESSKYPKLSDDEPIYHKRYWNRQMPKNHIKKKKAKRRQQKQARRRNK